MYIIKLRDNYENVNDNDTNNNNLVNTTCRLKAKCI